MENNERVSIILLSMVLFTWFTTLLKLPMNQKPASPRYAYDGLSDDKRRRQQNDDELPNMKSGYGTTNGMPSMMSHHQMMMDMQKPATGRQQKEALMPMDHEHQCLCRSA